MARSTSRTKRTHKTGGWRTWWEERSGRTQHVLCLAALLAVSLGFFAPIHFTGQALVGGDTVQWRAMAEAMIEYQSETGRPALWNPNAFAGMPGYMISYVNQVPQIDDLPALLREVVWPTSHFIFLLAGTYLLGFFLTRGKLAGVLGACAYGLTTYIPIILIAGHNTKFIALCFAPWLVFTFLYAMRRPRLLSGLLFAVALAANLRAGHVQITYYFTFVIGIWWLVELVGAFREETLPHFGRATGWLALGSLLGVLMVAQPYLVNAEYKAETIRGAGSPGTEQDGLDLDYAMRWSQGPGELLTLAIADAYGGGSGQGTYWGPKPFTEGPHYLGGIVLLLAALGLWRSRRRRAVWALGLAALATVLFALGRHFLALNELMYAYFPLFDAFRAPETWLSATAFTLAVLAVLGLAHVARREEDRAAEERKTRAVLIASGVAVGLAAFLWLFGGVVLDFERPGERRQIVQRLAQQRPDLSPRNPQVVQVIDQEIQRRRTERRDAFGSDALRTLLFLVLGGAALWGYRRGALPAWAMQAALALLVVLDLGGVGRRYLNEEALRPTDRITAQIPEYGFDRFILEQRREAGGPGHFRVASFEQGNPMTTARPSYYYESIGGYHGAKLRLYQDYIDHIFRDPETGLPNENALDLLNVHYLIAPQQLPGTEVAYRDEQTGYAVLRNPDALPRAFFVDSTVVIESPEATWQRLRSDDFDPREVALLPAPIEGFKPAPADTGAAASAVLESYSPREIVWTVETNAPRLLVVSEVYYPEGWHAYLDGEEVPIRRANYLLRAVAVPEGEHRLVMRFEPQSHRVGVWTSAVSTALVYGGVLALLGLAWRRREHRAGGGEEEASG